MGILTLIISSRGLVNAVQSAFKTIFPEEAKHRPMLLAWLMPLVIIPIVSADRADGRDSSGPQQLSRRDRSARRPDDHPAQIAQQSVAFAIVWAMVLLAYWRLPTTRPALGQTALVALFAALSLGALVLSFDLFFKVERYRSLYGALGGVVFILIGTYLAAIVFYLWAQCLYALGKVDVAALEKLMLADGPGAGQAGRGCLRPGPTACSTSTAGITPPATP